MISIISDIEIAESYIQRQGGEYYGDSIRDRVMNKILERNGVTKASFDSTMTWYGKNIDDYSMLLTKVEAELEKRRKSSTGKPATDEATDFWPYSRHYLLTSSMASDGLQFNIPVSEISRGSRINLKLRANAPINGQCLLGIVYADGSKGYNSFPMYGQNQVDVTLQSDTAINIKRIFGNLKFSGMESGHILVDSISLKELAPDSTKFYEIGSLKRF